MILTSRAGLPLLIALLMSSTAGVGCGDPASPTAPSVSQPPPPSQPGQQPGGLQPVVRTISPNTGSTAGGAWGTIRGSDFQRGATVTFGKNVPSAWVQDSETLLFWSDDPHAAGTVDVIVTNPGGAAATLTAGFTYAPPESFNFNGDWIAHAGPDYEIDMRFTIRNNELVSFSCGTSATLMPSASTYVRSGEFSLYGDAGLVISGKVVSSVNAVGAIDIPACSATQWWADRK